MKANVTVKTMKSPDPKVASSYDQHYVEKQNVDKEETKSEEQKKDSAPEVVKKEEVSPEPAKTDEKKEAGYDEGYSKEKNPNNDQTIDKDGEDDAEDCMCAHCNGTGKMKKAKEVEVPKAEKSEEEEKMAGSYDQHYGKGSEAEKNAISMDFGKEMKAFMSEQDSLTHKMFSTFGTKH